METDTSRQSKKFYQFLWECEFADNTGLEEPEYLGMANAMFKNKEKLETTLPHKHNNFLEFNLTMSWRCSSLVVTGHFIFIVAPYALIAYFSSSQSPFLDNPLTMKSGIITRKSLPHTVIKYTTCNLWHIYKCER